MSRRSAFRYMKIWILNLRWIKRISDQIHKERSHATTNHGTISIFEEKWDISIIVTIWLSTFEFFCKLNGRAKDHQFKRFRQPCMPIISPQIVNCSVIFNSLLAKVKPFWTINCFIYQSINEGPAVWMSLHLLIHVHFWKFYEKLIFQALDAAVTAIRPDVILQKDAYQMLPSHGTLKRKCWGCVTNVSC